MRELPPTAGLPLEWKDLFPQRGTPPLSQQLGTLLDVEDPQVTCSGTVALVLALSALAAESGRREVVVPAYTCPLVAMAVAHCGLTLRLCDLEADGPGMDPAALSAVCGAQTLAIVPTYLGGRVHDIQPVLERAAAIGARVIEDAAQAMGARHADGTPVGLRGDIGFYSLAVGKGLTMYEGGVVVSRHPRLRTQLRDIARTEVPRRPGWELLRSVQLIGYAALYTPRGLPLAYGVPLRRALRRGDLEKAAGDSLPAHIPLHRVGAWRQAVVAQAAIRWREHQAVLDRQAQWRIARLRHIERLGLIEDPPGARGVWPVLTLLMPDGVARDAVLRAFWGKGVGVGVPFARALPDYAALRGVVPLDDVPNARAFAARALTMTNSPWLDTSAFDRMVAGIESVLTAPATSRRPPVTPG